MARSQRKYDHEYKVFCVREYPNCKITVGIPRLENKKGQNLILQIG